MRESVPNATTQKSLLHIFIKLSKCDMLSASTPSRKSGSAVERNIENYKIKCKEGRGKQNENI